MIRVLIVEDDPMVAEINKRYIENIDGFQVIGWARDGKAALEITKNGQVDLLILDIFMPGMDGMKLLEHLRSKHSGIDVIFVTAAREKNIIDQGLKLGAVDYLIKPFKYERIKLALEKYKKRFELFHKCDEIDQSNIDRLFEVNTNNELPKGIHPHTLALVNEYIAKEAYEIDIHKLADELDISSVTARHYLEYLVQTNILQKDLKYGSVGRPNYIYHK